MGAVAVPNEPSISEVIKNGGSDEKDSSETGSSLPESIQDDKKPQETNEIDTNPPSPNPMKDQPVPLQVKKLVNEEKARRSPESVCGSFDERKTEKSPLRSILKKSPSTSSASAVMLSDSPKVLNSENTFELASISKSLPSLNESILK